MVIEGVGRGEDRKILFFGFVFGESDGGDLWFGKDAEDFETVIDQLFLRVVEAAEQGGGVGGCDFALFDGDVDDFVGSTDITSSKDVGDICDLGVVGKDSVIFNRDACLVQLERIGRGTAAKGHQNFAGANDEGRALILKVDRFSIFFGGDLF